MKKIKILFADDHSIVRNGLRALFRSTPDISIVGGARRRRGGESRSRAQTTRSGPGYFHAEAQNGIEATRIIKQHHPEVKILSSPSRG
jgi:DNA-binding NarL/FixJ family response regulator